MALKFTRMQISDAALLLKWRTSPEITQHMYTDMVEPSIAKQEAWINAMNSKDDYFGYIILDAFQPVGFLCFTDIEQTHSRCSTGSYIYERKARLKYALTLHTYICNYAFVKLQLNKIVNYVMDANAKVVKLQKLHKTRLVGCLHQHIVKNGSYHDVHVFEQLKQDWTQQKQHFDITIIKAAFDDWE